ncbi:MAG: CBS domain-containing protein [Bacteroidales bacterium]|nr:CBS domain-containing protein [Bacteroidales bacterium]
MIVENYISNHIIPLKIDDSFDFSLKLMEEGKLSYFPVLDGNIYCGLISDLNLYELENLGEKISDKKDLLKDIFIYNTQTIFEASNVVLENNLDILPVVDVNKRYLGVLTIATILKVYTMYTAANEQGDVLQLTINYNDLYISEISKIIEGEDAKIINLFVIPIKETTQLRVIIKLNKMGLCRVVKSLERYGYNVEYFTKIPIEDEMNKNYELLMKYLSI